MCECSSCGKRALCLVACDTVNDRLNAVDDELTRAELAHPHGCSAPHPRADLARAARPCSPEGSPSYPSGGFLSQVISGWISVDDNLPDDGETVIVAMPDHWDPVDVGYLEEGEWTNYEGEPHTGVVTHWMPMPEPPSKEAA